jgi:hypothetical protein
MRKLSERSAMIVSGVAATVVIAGGTIAYGAFKGTGTASAGQQGTESFAPLTVTGTWIGVTTPDNVLVSARMLPGESADVRITLTNPSANTVQGKVTTITPVKLNPSDINAANRARCVGALRFSSYRTTATDAIVVARDSTVPVILKDAVTLDAAADDACAGMSFPTDFVVGFTATHDSVGSVDVLHPVAS